MKFLVPFFALQALRPLSVYAQSAPTPSNALGKEEVAKRLLLKVTKKRQFSLLPLHRQLQHRLGT